MISGDSWSGLRRVVTGKAPPPPYTQSFGLAGPSHSASFLHCDTAVGSPQEATTWLLDLALAVFLTLDYNKISKIALPSPRCFVIAIDNGAKHHRRDEEAG